VNQTLIQKLQEFADPRLPVYAQENDNGEYRGVAPGIAEPTINGFDFKNTSQIGEYFLEADAPAVFMDYAELNFLLAEAVVQGYISGDAQSYYEAGIGASFDTYGLAPGSYLTNDGVEWSEDDAIEQIFVQKWLALYGQGFEAWTEWRRSLNYNPMGSNPTDPSGYPELSPAQDPILINTIPTRYYYPAKEQTLNTANWREASNAVPGGDDLDGKVWWMQ
jgi:hypothetical protein